MRYITVFEAKEIHKRLTAQTGGDSGLRDEGLLISAIKQCEQTFGGVELYPTVLEKAAVLGHSLIANHAFVDGNKRIGMLLMLTFLKINGYEFSVSSEDIADAGFATARGDLTRQMLCEWIENHKK